MWTQSWKSQKHGLFREERRYHCWKAAGVHENGVPILEISNSARAHAVNRHKVTFATVFLQLIQLLLKWTFFWHSVEAEFSSLTDSISLDSLSQTKIDSLSILLYSRNCHLQEGLPRPAPHPPYCSALHDRPRDMVSILPFFRNDHWQSGTG